MARWKDFTLTTGVLLGMGALVVAQRIGDVIAARRLAERPTRSIRQLIQQINLPWYDGDESYRMSIDLYRLYLGDVMSKVLALNDLNAAERETIATWLEGEYGTLIERATQEGDHLPATSLFEHRYHLSVQEEKE
jgi:hypothetical protein